MHPKETTGTPNTSWRPQDLCVMSLRTQGVLRDPQNSHCSGENAAPSGPVSL